MHRQQMFLLLLCVSLNIVNIISEENEKERAFPVKYGGPNFDPELPNFGPFNSQAFVRLTEDDDDDNEATVQDDSPPALIAEPTDAFNGKQKINPAKDTEFTERIKPLQDFVMGLYQNYRSTFVGNQSISDFISPYELLTENKLDEATLAPQKASKKRKTKTKKKHVKVAAGDFPGDDVKYNVGPGVNVSLDPEKELVNVYLDEDCLKDVFTGRGRKHDIIHKILPLFILPFLIQSAIVPFVVTTLKLLLVKSIVVGKIAIFLLIISAFKNKHSGQYEAAPSYIVDPPSRRSEAAVGYRVEGKPTTWVN